jgi:hypothetical protein
VALNGSVVFLDPTDETRPAARTAIGRPAGLDGLRIGLLDINKARGNVFLDRVEQLLTGRGLAVARYAKPTFTRPMPPDLRREITARCDVVIEALAD